MIAGVGVDLVALPAFAAQLADPASRFAEAAFSAAERDDAARVGDRVSHLAARFAAKEAFIKAWSGGRRGLEPALGHVVLQEIEVVLDDWGRPALRLHGATRAAFERDGPARIHCSLSHDGPTAVAFVVVERG